MEWIFIKVIAAVVGALAIAAFVIMSTWTTIRDLYSFLFRRERFLMEQYGAIIEHVINEIADRLGILRHAPRHRALSLYLDSGNGVPSLEETYKDKLEEIISDHIHKTQARIGNDTKVNYQYYVDLRASLTRTDLADILGAILVSFIRNCIKEQSITFDYVAAHREGSTILAYVVAHAFSLPLLLVNRSSRWSIDGKQIFVEGDVSKTQSAHNRKKVLLVDDSVSGGGVIHNAVQMLTSSGYEVRDAFVLFSRTEDTATKRLKEDGVSLHSIFQLNDAKLAEMSSAIILSESPLPKNNCSQSSEPKAFPYFLRRLNLYVNLICPNRCKHCCVGPMLNGKQMTYEEAKHYVDMAAQGNKSLNELMILGGEPSLWLHTPALIEHAKARGIKDVSLCTSGYDWQKIIPYKDLLSHVVVSLDGFSENSHDSIRCEGAYATALTAIESFRKASLAVKVIFTANSSNIDEIKLGIEKMEILGVNEINFHVISETGYAKENRFLLLNDTQWISTRQFLSSYQGPMKIKYPIKYATSDEFEILRTENYQCMLAQIDRLNVFPGGDCFACCLFLDTSSLIHKYIYK